MKDEEKHVHSTEKEEKHYICDTCREKFDITDARKREMACCGQPLLRTEYYYKCTPEPFGP